MSNRITKRACPACTAGALGLAAVATLVGAFVGSPAPARASLPPPLSASQPSSSPPTFSAPPTLSAPPPANTASAEDIRDIRGPKRIPPAWLVPALIAIVAALAIGGYAAWRWKQRRRLPRALRPFEIALQRLADIRPLLDPSSVREFSIAISDIVREYIEAEFRITATHRTTEEFLHDLLDSPQSKLAAHRNLLAQFLEQCDMAKFAGMSLTTQIMESLHQSARTFVVETSKPAPAGAREGPELSRIKEARDSLPST